MAALLALSWTPKKRTLSTLICPPLNAPGRVQDKFWAELRRTEQSKRESLGSLTATKWHESSKERISPPIGEPIFHQASAGCKCWGEKRGKREVLHSSRPPRSGVMPPQPLNAPLLGAQSRLHPVGLHQQVTRIPGRNTVLILPRFLFSFSFTSVCVFCVSVRPLEESTRANYGCMYVWSGVGG